MDYIMSFNLFNRDADKRAAAIARASNNNEEISQPTISSSILPIKHHRRVNLDLV